MRCCQSAACDTGRLFSRFAARYRKRYRRRGLERSQKQLVAGLDAARLGTYSMLEIGCGVGYLHQHLLTRGGTRAVGVDLSERMLAEARALAAEDGFSTRVDYLVGDFVNLAEQIARVDVSLLDKVICCYPDAYILVQRALDKTERACALIYPRRHLLNRCAIAIAAFLMAVTRNAYRPYFYEPEEVRTWIEERGFHRTWQAETPLWRTEVYQRVQ
ncbi:MAG: class I SAM-dependent methyltransferase [Acidiferrobacteraceae bacterium]